MTRDEQLDEQLEKYTLNPEPIYVAEIREIIHQEIANENREDNEIFKLSCMQLFSIGQVEDSLLIWRAKQSNFDAACYLDIQFLCGAGLDETKNFLSEQNTSEALGHLIECEKSGDFEDFSVASHISEYQRYFQVS